MAPAGKESTFDASRHESLRLLAGLALASRRVAAAEPPPETRRLRLARFPFELICLAPMWIAEELLRADGFDDLQYVAPTGKASICSSRARSMPCSALRPSRRNCARGVGMSIVNTTIDKPWSQYFCCIAFANRSFVGAHPVATRRALRALLKAADICAAEPAQSARKLVAQGFSRNVALAAQSLREIPYRRWREFDSADSLRFYALRLHEVGAIKSSPDKLIAQGSDWRFIEQLKRELKS